MRYDQIDCFNHNSLNTSLFWMIYGLLSSENPCQSRVMGSMGTGVGTASNTHGLPMPFTINDKDLHVINKGETDGSD
jgi:hypothetical protein